MRSSFSDPVEILPGIFRHIKFKTRYDADNTIKSYINTRANTAQKKIYNKHTKKKYFKFINKNGTNFEYTELTHNVFF